MQAYPVDCDLSISWTESSSLGPAISRWDAQKNLENKMTKNPKPKFQKWKFPTVQTLHNSY